MLIDDYMNYLNENYEIYDEESVAKIIGSHIADTAGMARNYVRNSRADGTFSMRGLGSTIADGVDSTRNYIRNTKADRVAERAAKKLDRKNKAKLNIDRAKLAKGAKGLAKGGAALAAGGAAVYGAKKLHDHIKAKRSEKAKEVAVEEGVSLEEAYSFILECEMDLINEGYELYELYED